MSRIFLDEPVLARQSSTDELIDFWLMLLEISAEERLIARSQSAQLRRFSTALAKPGLLDKIVETATECEPRVADH